MTRSPHAESTAEISARPTIDLKTRGPLARIADDIRHAAGHLDRADQTSIPDLREGLFEIAAEQLTDALQWLRDWAESEWPEQATPGLHTPTLLGAQLVPKTEEAKEQGPSELGEDWRNSARWKGALHAPQKDQNDPSAKTADRLATEYIDIRHRAKDGAEPKEPTP